MHIKVIYIQRVLYSGGSLFILLLLPLSFYRLLFLLKLSFFWLTFLFVVFRFPLFSYFCYGDVIVLPLSNEVVAIIVTLETSFDILFLCTIPLFALYCYPFLLLSCCLLSYLCHAAILLINFHILLLSTLRSRLGLTRNCPCLDTPPTRPL